MQTQTELTSQQASFFTKNGYIEFENVPFDPKLIKNEAEKVLDQRSAFWQKTTPNEIYASGRDLWRDSAYLKRMALHVFGSIAKSCSMKTKLRLALDQWVPQGYPWQTKDTINHLFALQNTYIAVLCTIDPPNVRPKPPRIGISPLTKHPTNALFVKTDLLIHFSEWTHAKTDAYILLYALENVVYAPNPQDPLMDWLKQFGYTFGDKLENKTHPFLH